MRFFTRKYVCGSIFALLLTLFTLYVILDAFVIPRKMESVTNADDYNTASDSTDVNNAAADKDEEVPLPPADTETPVADITSGERQEGEERQEEDEEEPSIPATTEPSSVAGWIEDGVTYPVITETSYKDENICIELSFFTENDTAIYVADIQITDIKYLKSAFAYDTYGKNITEKTSEMAEANNALLAVNGDYYGFRNYGFVLRNGVLFRDTSYDSQAMVINIDGSVFTAFETASSAKKLAEDGAWQIFSFGPAIIENGQISISTKTEVETASRSNPRTAFGVLGELHYVFVTSDGRTEESKGLKLYELAQFMESLGCTYAYNLDGGGSTTFWFNGKVINNPTNGTKAGERRVSDIVYIGY